MNFTIDFCKRVMRPTIVRPSSRNDRRLFIARLDRRAGPQDLLDQFAPRILIGNAIQIRPALLRPRDAVAIRAGQLFLGQKKLFAGLGVARMLDRELAIGVDLLRRFGGAGIGSTNPHRKNMAARKKP